MRFSQDFIDKVRDANNIVDLISRYTELKSSGDQFIGLCPFPDHREKTPSFSVSENKQVYYCFGCKNSGNIFNFIESFMGMNFPEAVEWLACQAGIPVPQEMNKHSESTVDQEKDYRLMIELNEFAAKFFESELQHDGSQGPAHQYLKKRGLSQEVIQSFRLGYAPSEWEKLSQLLRARRTPLSMAEKLGLVRARGLGKIGYYDLFRQRLMFPIFRLDGCCIGFGGRALDDSEPKYLNSSESVLFHKGQVFYGLFETVKFIRSKDQVVVVEGYIDLLALYQKGIKNVVAPLGTALTEGHARLLKRFTKNVVVLFDGDKAGQNAAERSLPILLKAGLIPRGLTLPGGVDPDDFVKTRGVKKLQEMISQAQELFVEVLNRETQGFCGTPGEKITLIDKIGPILQAVPDRRLRSLYSEEVGVRLGVTQEWLKQALNQIKSSQRFLPPATRRQGAPPEPGKALESPEVELPERISLVGKRPKAEELLVNLALTDLNYMLKIDELDIVERFSHKGLQQVLRRALHIYRQMPNEFDKLTALLVSQVDLPDVLFVHLQKQLADLNSEGARKLIADCSRKVQDAYLKAQSRQLKSFLRGRSASEQLEKLEQIMNIHRDRRVLNKDTDTN